MTRHLDPGASWQLPASVCPTVKINDKRAWVMTMMSPLTIGTIFGGNSSN